MVTTESIRRAIINQGAFFSPYYLFDLLGRQHADELDPLGREANRRLLRQTYRKAFDRYGETGSKAGEAWQAWYEELFTALGFDAARLQRINAPVNAGRFGLVPISHAAYASSQASAEPPLVFVDLHGFGTDLDREMYLGRGKVVGQSSITIEPISRAVEFALDQNEPRWAIVAAGERLRLYRKGGSVARQYLEVDFTPLFDGDRTDEWTAFWGLFRYDAFVPDPSSGKCLLDRVLEESQRHAARIADDLRENIVLAVEALIQGVLDEPANQTLVDGDDPEALQQLFEESLYFLYRLLFVLYAESRDLLPLGESPVYRDTYSLEHLRAMAEQPIHPDDYYKTYYSESLRTLIGMLRGGFPTADRPMAAPPFRIPAFNGQLFDQARTALLDRCRIGDRAMREVIRELSLSRPRRRHERRERYSYADLGVDQLGSIYEGLLVYEPMIVEEEMVVAKVKGEERLLTRDQADANNLAIIEGSARKPGAFVLRIWGGRRKGSGSYYTPQEITAFLVKEALEPLVDPIVAGCAERDASGRPRRSPDEILELKVCDPAMGSAAFLVQACRYLAEAYGRARIAAGADEDGRIAQEELVRFKRRIAERCLYGVDLNPMAVELAKVSLWLETLSGDRPLTFLDAHLRCGNALIGAPLRDEHGALSVERLLSIPDAALEEVSKEATKAQKAAARERIKRNREQIKAVQKQRAGNLTLEGFDILSVADLEQALADTLERRLELEISDEGKSAADAVQLVHAKQRMLANLEHGPASRYRRAKLVLDLWCAAWFWPEPGTPLADEDETPDPPTTTQYLDLVAHILAADEAQLAALGREPLLATAMYVAAERRFFHWELELPEVFGGGRGGFDAIVANPPWDTISSNPKEFFSNYDPLFRDLQGKRARDRVNEFCNDPEINERWHKYDRSLLQLASYLKESSIYTWYAPGNLGKGDFNVYRTFIERSFQLLREGGIMSELQPDAFYVAANASAVRRALLTKGKVKFLYVIENHYQIFPIDTRIRLVLIGVQRGGTTTSINTLFLIGKSTSGKILAPEPSKLKERLAMLHQESIPMPVSLISLLSPGTWSPPELRHPHDAHLMTYFASHFSALGDLRSGWIAKLNAELHGTSDSDLFVDSEFLIQHGTLSQTLDCWYIRDKEYWPLYDGRMIYHFNAHYAPFDKWVPAHQGLSRMRITNEKAACLYYRLAWRDVSRSTDERTVITAILPPRTFAKNTAQTLQGGLLESTDIVSISCVMNSFVFDYQARVRGKRLNFANIAEINILTRDRIAALIKPGLKIICISPEFGNLWTEVAPVAGLHSGWTPDLIPVGFSRSQLRAEIDALVADLYGLSEEDFAYILSTFPLLDRGQPALAGDVDEKGAPRSYITRDMALLELFKLRGKEAPADIVVFFAAAGADIARLTGPMRGLGERAAAALALGAAGYVPGGRGAKGEEGEEEEAEA